ncbi:MAG: hypothetical protein WC755_02815 [Candidatus Woesearchaeota archaeon]|jgi:hypothetical protein
MNTAQIALYRPHGQKILQQLYDTVLQKISSAYQKVRGQVKQDDLETLTQTHCPAKEQEVALIIPIAKPIETIDDNVIEITNKGPLIDNIRESKYYPRGRTICRLPENCYGFSWTGR